MEKIGFIGLGAMGRPMSSNLKAKGFDLIVYDREPAAIEALAALGATPAESVAAVARAADIVITMLPDSPDVEDVVLGPEGVARHGRPDQLLMDMSTIDPATTDRLAQALGQRGMAFVDASVGRTVAFAERGQSLFMVGASDNDFGRVRDVLGAMGDAIHHCGPPGAGIRTKLVNNYIAVITAQVSAEGLALAARFGLDIAKTLDVVNGTTATNGQLKLTWPSKVLAGDIEPGFRIALAHKDVALALNAARAAGVPAFVGAAALECLGQARRTGDFADKDFSALLDVVCAQAGIRPPRLD